MFKEIFFVLGVKVIYAQIILNTSQIQSLMDTKAQNIYLQTVENATFSLDFIFSGLQYMITITIDDVQNETLNNTFYGVLAYSQGEPAYAVQRSIIADKIDTNSYYLRKKVFYMPISTSSDMFNVNLQQYLTFLIPKGMNVTYQMKIEVSFFLLCPNDCGNERGTCSNVLGICRCDHNYLDVDCSIEGTMLDTNQIYITQLTSQPLYLYYQPPPFTVDNYIITIKGLTNTSISIYGKIEGTGLSSLPNSIENDELMVLTSGDVKKFYVQNSNLGYSTIYLRPRRILLAVYYNDTNEIQNSSIRIVVTTADSFSDKYDPTWLIVYLAVGIAAFLLLLWGGFVLIKYRYYSQVQLNRVQHLPRGNNIQQLSAETLNKYMPIILFDLLQQNKETTCAVCLIEFENNDKQRMTPCQHYFHSECIEAWFKKHQNCPICRQELTQETLAKHFDLAKQRMILHSENTQMVQPQEQIPENQIFRNPQIEIIPVIASQPQVEQHQGH